MFYCKCKLCELKRHNEDYDGYVKHLKMLNDKLSWLLTLNKFGSPKLSEVKSIKESISYWKQRLENSYKYVEFGGVNIDSHVYCHKREGFKSQWKQVNVSRATNSMKVSTEVIKDYSNTITETQTTSCSVVFVKPYENAKLLKNYGC